MLEAPAVIHLRHRVLVGHLFWLDEVAPAQGNPVDTGLPRCLVHQPLHDVDRLGPPGTAVGAHRRRVRQHRLEMEVDRLDVVDTGLHPGPDHQRYRDSGAGGVGTHIGMCVHAQCQYAAAGVERELCMALGVAPGGAAEEFLAALGDPLDGALECPGTPGGDRVLRMHAALHSEASAHVAHRHTYLFARDAEYVFAQRIAHAAGHLAAHAQRQPPVARVDKGEDGSRLQRDGRQALVGDVQ